MLCGWFESRGRPSFGHVPPSILETGLGFQRSSGGMAKRGHIARCPHLELAAAGALSTPIPAQIHCASFSTSLASLLSLLLLLLAVKASHTRTDSACKAGAVAGAHKRMLSRRRAGNLRRPSSSLLPERRHAWAFPSWWQNHQLDRLCQDAEGKERGQINAEISIFREGLLGLGSSLWTVGDVSLKGRRSS